MAKAVTIGCRQLTIFEDPWETIPKELGKVKLDETVDVDLTDTAYTHMHNLECAKITTSDGISGYAVVKGLKLV